MKIEPIDIDIENNQIYAQVAFLIDHPETLKGVELVKSKFEISKPFTSGDYKAWKDHLLGMSGFNLQEYYEMEIVKPNDDKWSEKSNWLGQNHQCFVKWTELSAQFDIALAKIRKARRFPPVFDFALKQVVLFDKVSEFQTAKAGIEFTPAYNPYFDPSVAEDAVISIKVSPLTTEKDLVSVFNEAKENLRKEYEFITPLRELPTKELRAIKRNRFVYWKRTGSPITPFEDILDEWNDKCPAKGDHNNDADNCPFCGISDKNVLEQGFSEYKERLFS